MIDKVRTYETRAAGDKDIVHINELLSHKKAQKAQKQRKENGCPLNGQNILVPLVPFRGLFFRVFTLSRKSIDASPSVRPMLIQPRAATGFQSPARTVCSENKRAIQLRENP